MPGTRVGRFRDDGSRSRFLAAYRRAMAELPEPDETSDVTTSFGSVRVYRFDCAGGRAPLVLLPGRAASTPMWHPNLAGFVAQRTVYAVDLLGEPGMSVQRRVIADAADQAAWFGEMVDGLALPGAHLLGVSFGGWTAVNAAVHRPDRVLSVTLLDPVLTFAPIPLTTMLAMAPMGVPGTPERYRQWALRYLSGGAPVDDSDPIAALIASGGRDFVSRQPLPSRFTERQLRGLGVPVLAILAGRSVIHDPRRAARTASAQLRHGHIEVWPDASHALHGEFPDRIDQRVRQFLDTTLN